MVLIRAWYRKHARQWIGFKMEAAAEVGVNLKQGYNGDLTSRQAGSVGGQMVKKMCPVHTSSFARECRTAVGHCVSVQYIAGWL